MTQQKSPRYQHIYNIIRTRIEQGEYAPGTRLPTESGFTQEFGVSLITVKRALELLASDGLVRRIQGKGSFVTDLSDPAQDTPNSSHIIGLIMDDFLAGFGAGIVDSIETAAAAQGYQLVPLRSGGDQQRESTAIHTLLSAGAEALIITPVHGEYYNEEILRLMLKKFPVVFLDRKLEGIPVPFIGSDNYNAAQLGLQHLYDLGHRQILILAPAENAFSLSERYRGIHDFTETHKDATCTFSHLKLVNNSETSLSLDQLRSILRARGFSAIFCMQYKLALMTEHAARSLGLQIPEDLSVICFDESDDVPGTHFFTHIQQPEQQLGAAAIKAVFQFIASPKSTLSDVKLPVQLVEGESTAKPNAAFK